MLLKSECGKYLLRQEPDKTTGLEMLDADGTVLGKTTCWSNCFTTTHYRFLTGFGEYAATFQYPRYPKWFRRRWVKIWKIDLEKLAKLIRRGPDGPPAR